MKCFFLTAKSS